MYGWFLTGVLFSSILAFGSKYIYASTTRHIAALSLCVTILTYALLFIPDHVTSCSPCPIEERMAAFFVLILFELLRVLSGGSADILLPGVISAHVVSHFATRLDGASGCDFVQFGSGLLIVVVCGLSLAWRWRSSRRKSRASAGTPGGRLKVGLSFM